MSNFVEYDLKLSKFSLNLPKYLKYLKSFLSCFMCFYPFLEWNHTNGVFHMKHPNFIHIPPKEIHFGKIEQPL
jgi:hypothetical protein